MVIIHETNPIQNFDLYHQLNDDIFNKMKNAPENISQDDYKNFLELNIGAITEIAKSLHRYTISNVIDKSDVEDEVLTVAAEKLKADLVNRSEFDPFFWINTKRLTEDSLVRQGNNGGFQVSRRSILRKTNDNAPWSSVVSYNELDENSYNMLSSSDDIDSIVAKTDIEYVKENLSDREWFVMEAFYLKGLSHSEIAKELDISENLSRSILYRAIKNSREILHVEVTA